MISCSQQSLETELVPRSFPKGTQHSILSPAAVASRLAVQAGGKWKWGQEHPDCLPSFSEQWDGPCGNQVLLPLPILGEFASWACRHSRSPGPAPLQPTAGCLVHVTTVWEEEDLEAACWLCDLHVKLPSTLKPQCQCCNGNLESSPQTGLEASGSVSHFFLCSLSQALSQTP